MDEYGLQLPPAPDNSPQNTNAAKPNEAARMISRLLSSFPERDSDEGDIDARLRAFLIAIEGYSERTLLEAEKRILKGQTDCDPRFMPTPPQLAKLCGAVSAEMRVTPSMPKTELLDKFMAPPDPNVVLKFERVKKELSRSMTRFHTETRAEWIERMGDKITKT